MKFMKTTLYLVRHGEYENPDYLFPGRSVTGYPLSQLGREQVKRLANYFVDKTIVALYSSPILRCKQTAEILFETLRTPVVYDDRLMEVRTMGEGISMNRFDENPTLSYAPHYHAMGAESMEEVAERMYGFIEEKRKAHEGKEVLIVTHGDPMRMAVMRYRNMPYTPSAHQSVPIPLAGGYRLEFEDTGRVTCDTIQVS